MSDLTEGSGDGHEPPERGRVHRLCARCVTATGTTGGSVTVMSRDGDPVRLLSTDHAARQLEDLQTTLGEGPRVDAWESNGPVLAPDLTTLPGASARWPAFVEGALTAGRHAHFAFPVVVGAIKLGVLSLYRHEPGDLTTTQLAAALDTVDLLSQALLDLSAAQDWGTDVRYDMVVHQAAGMVMVQLDVTIKEALARLRAHAYGEGVQISVLASEVVHGRRRFEREQ